MKFSLSSPLLLLSLVSIFVSITLNSFLINCLSPFCLVPFLEFCLVLSFGKYSFVSSLCLTLCVSFYVLGRSAPYPSLERVALCVVQFPMVTRASFSWGFPCLGCMHPLIVVGPQLLWAHWLRELAPGLAGCIAWLWLRRCAVGGTDPQVGAPWRGCWCWPRWLTRLDGVRATLEGHQCQLVPPARWSGHGVVFEGPSKVGPQGNVGAGYTVLARLIESNRNGAHQSWASQLCGRRVKKIKTKRCPQVLLPLEKVLPDPCLSKICPNISQWISFLYDSGVFQAVTSLLGPGASEFVRKHCLQFPAVLWLSRP